MSKKHSNNLLAVLDAKNGTRIRCAFHYCLRPAWTLSKRGFVELDVENHDYAPLLTILSKACGRNLNVHVGAIGSVAGALGQRSEFDHALIIPPIGLRQKFGPPLMSHFVGMKAEDLTAESFAALWGASLGRERNVVVVGNGMLFRRSGMGTAFKRGLIERQGLEAVVSLPRGIFPGTSIGVSALVFSGDGATRSRRETMRFINGSDPAALGPAPLSKLLSNKSTDPLCVDASIREVSEGGFNLLVDRYVWDPAVQIHREMLNQHETVRLADLADIHGPQTLPRASIRGEGLEVREALLGDVVDGRLSLPAKLSELAEPAATRIATTFLAPGDILLSIRGAIGKVALITDDLVAQSGPLPIAAGQSFAIVRLRKGGAIGEPEVLFSYLRSPVAQSLLQGMTGGTTITKVAIRDLKAMQAPVLSVEQQQNIVRMYQECNNIQRDIDILAEKRKVMEAKIITVMLDNSRCKR